MEAFLKLLMTIRNRMTGYLYPGPYGSSYGLANRAEQESNQFLFLTIQRWRNKALPLWCLLKASAHGYSGAFGHSLLLPHTPSLWLPVPMRRHSIHCMILILFFKNYFSTCHLPIAEESNKTPAGFHLHCACILIPGRSI